MVVVVMVVVVVVGARGPVGAERVLGGLQQAARGALVALVARARARRAALALGRQDLVRLLLHHLR